MKAGLGLRFAPAAFLGAAFFAGLAAFFVAVAFLATFLVAFFFAIVRIPPLRVVSVRCPIETSVNTSGRLSKEKCSPQKLFFRGETPQMSFFWLFPPLELPFSRGKMCVFDAFF